MQRPRAAPGTNTSRAVETAVGTGTLGRPITSRQSPRLSRHGNSPKRRHKRHGDRQLTQQSGRRSPKGVPNGLSPLSPVVYAGWRPTGVKPSAAVGVWPQVRYLSPRSRLGTAHAHMRKNATISRSADYNFLSGACPHWEPRSMASGSQSGSQRKPASSEASFVVCSVRFRTGTRALLSAFRPLGSPLRKSPQRNRLPRGADAAARR